jgi:hypothetical protein
MATVWDPPRFARAYAAPDEPGLPYLRPYDVFDYLPIGDDRLSYGRNEDLDKLVPTPGMILQTCSGRNLGPCSMTDEFVGRFALSHDMIRIEIPEPELRFYVYAFLKTSFGQLLLRRSMSGSVIDHLTTSDVRAVPVPLFDQSIRSEVERLSASSVTLVTEARRRVNDLLRDQLQRLPPEPLVDRLRDGWTIAGRDLVDRIDASYYAPQVRAARAQLLREGGVRLGELASAALPVRYKRYYVDGDNGRPILSGRQLLQFHPINLRRVSDRSFKNPKEYEVKAGMTIFGAVGRAEGRQGTPALVTSDRDGWLASNDVMRLVPRTSTSPGALWLATATTQVRTQVNALSFGSVIDHMNPWDVEDVIVPLIEDGLACEVEDAWELFAQARAAERQATALLEARLNES